MLNSSQAGPFGTIEYRILSEDKIELALEVQQKSMKFENIANGIGLYEEKNAAEEIKAVFYEIIKDNLTVIAVENKSGKVVGVSFNKIHRKPIEGMVDPLEEVVMNNIKTRSCLALIELLNDIEMRVDIYDKYNIETAMEIFYIGTDPKYCGYQIGRKLVETSINLAKQLKLNGSNCFPEVVFGVFTSNYSQKIAKTFNFEWLYEANYSDLEYWGKTMADRIGSEHKSVIYGALKL